MYFIFLSDGGALSVAGPGVAYPLPHPLDGPGENFVILAYSVLIQI